MARSKYEYVNFGNYLFYSALELYVKFVLLFLFRRVQFNGKENVSKTKPVFFAINHQSAFIDPVMVGYYTYRRPWYITRAGVFNTAISRFFFKALHMLPIFRNRDNVEDVVKANENTFKKSIDILKTNGAMLIFPEGNHGMRKRLRSPLQKGFARMVFDAEKECDYKLGIDIIPTGIFYEHPTKFRTDAFVNFGKPINSLDYVGLYKDQPNVALKQISQDLALKMSEVMIDLESKEGYDEIEKKWHEARPKENDLNKRFLSDKRIIKKILNGEKIPPHTAKENKMIKIIGAIFGAPIFVYGLLNNLIVYLFTKWFLKKKVKDPHFLHSIMYAFGITALPLITFFQSLLIQGLFHNIYITVLYFITTPFIGLIAYDYYDIIFRKKEPYSTTELMKGFGSL